ncbi:unnamed protein product [Blepharisma stoltei]|uniref:Protein kinase domain-containing protein n=1 Tax=Blepharisma stoltei TaxID=1481888 RepID=A0AAU9IUJ0_9CILI|nr:unnamed protein product [Blepharisma stoltei]
MVDILDSYYSSFEAEDYHLGNSSTLKKVTFKKWSKGSQYPRTGVMKIFLRCREEFQKEAHYLMRASKCHHGIVQFYHEMVVNGQYHIFMEYCEKDSLGDIISNKCQNKVLLSITQQLKYFVTITEALAALHEAGIAHRDIKPNNIFLNESNEIKIGDFGESKEIRFGEQNTVLGTCTYMSPFLAKCFEKKIFKSKLIDPFKEDVWSAGKTLYEFAIMSVYTSLPKSEDKLKNRVRSDMTGYGFPDEVIEIVLDMLIYDHKIRPSMAEICERLKSAYFSEMAAQNLEHQPLDDAYATDNQDFKEEGVDLNDWKLTKNGQDLNDFSLSSFCVKSENPAPKLLEKQDVKIDSTEQNQLNEYSNLKLCLKNDSFMHGCGKEIDRDTFISFIKEVLLIETDYSNVACSFCGNALPKEIFSSKAWDIEEI